MNDQIAVEDVFFGDAVRAAEKGHRIARKGWNGKGMWLSYTPGMMVPAEKFWSPANKKFAEENGGQLEVLPYLTMKTADNKVVPWLASQTDVLASDWVIYAKD